MEKNSLKLLRYDIIYSIREFGLDLFVSLDDVAGDGESAALQEPDEVVPDQRSHRVQPSLELKRLLTVKY